jgi:glycosyltransferase involved in cell wall biosynthesis
MKITFILPWAGMAGGVRVVAIYAELLQQRGHEVQVVCSHAPPAKSWRSWLQAITNRLKGKRPPSHFDHRSITPKVISAKHLRQGINVPDADIVVATWWETAAWVSQYPSSKGAKVYLIQHDERVFEGQPKQNVQATWCSPMHKIVISQWLADLVRQECGPEPVTLIPNSVDAKQFSAPPRGKQPLPTVGVMYSNETWKGCDISLAAAELARRTIPDLQLIAFGAHPPSAKLPLPKQAQFFQSPNQSDIKDIYAQCDAWLFGSRLEGFGLPILEAMACRTPVIGTTAGAAPELLSEDAGLLIEARLPNQPLSEATAEIRQTYPMSDADWGLVEAMAKAIEQICQMSEQEWKTMSTLAYQKATGYTWDDATDRFEAVLYQAIEQSAQTLAKQIRNQQLIYLDQLQSDPD